MKKKVLELTEQEAIELYKESGEKMKSILENNFGRKLFYKDIRERLNNFQDCINETGLPDAKNINEIPEEFHKWLLSLYRNAVIARAYSEGMRFNIFDSNIRRYYPNFITNKAPSRFAFDRSLFGSTCASAGSGSRICFESEEKSNDYGKKFKNEIIEMLTK
jgi:hypothetical protein